MIVKSVSSLNVETIVTSVWPLTMQELIMLDYSHFQRVAQHSINTMYLEDLLLPLCIFIIIAYDLGLFF